MAEEQLTRAILDRTTTDTVERDVGKPSWSLAEGVFEEYGSPYWHKGRAKALIDIFTREEVSPWIGLAVMKREASFGNTGNNPSLDERNIADPFGVHFNENPNWPAGAKKNLLLVPEAGASYVNKANPEASAVGYRLPTFEESAHRCAVTIRNRTLVKYNPRGLAYKAEIDDHLRQILRRTFNNHRLREELQRIFAERRGGETLPR
jgi:hypothetical protein